jgi:ABC-type transport system substrate-binding protein
MFTTQAPAVKFIESRGYKNKAIQMPKSMHYFAVYFNSLKPPFNNPDLRKALLLYGLDWKAIAAGCSEGLGWAGVQLAIPGSYDYDPEIEKDSYYDLDKAKAMIKKAGFGDGFDTEIIFAHPVYNNLAAALQDHLKRNFNIKAKVTLTTAAAKMRSQGTKPGIFLWHVGGHLDPTVYMATRMNRGGSYGKLMAFSDEYENMFKKVTAATTLEEKKDKLRKLNRILYIDDALGRNGYMTGNFVFLKDRVQDSGLESEVYTPEVAYVTDK